MGDHHKLYGPGLQNRQPIPDDTGLDPPRHPNPSQFVGEVRDQLKRSRREPQGTRVQEAVEAKMREFTSGATRHTDEGKLDYEGFLSPLVLRRFAEYMHANRVQADGELRTSDNWQKGIPTEQYMKSLLRHVMDTWEIHRDFLDDPAEPITEHDQNLIQEALCGVLFNAMGYLHELLKGQ